MNNNMKKYLILAAAAIVAMAACSKVETDYSSMPDVKVGYQVASYAAQTKADPTEHSFLTELSELGVTSGQSFKSVAYINADNGNGGTTLQTFYATSPETISWDATNTQWAPSHDYYWPKSPNSDLDFFSWYDFDGSAANPTLSYDGTDATMTWANRTVALKSNILFADVAFHQTKNKKNNPAYGFDSVSEGVPTLFHHALAQVRFRAKIKDNCDKKEDSKNSGKYTFWEVKLSGVKIADNKVHKNGTLTLTVADPDAGQNLTPVAWDSAAWGSASSPAYAATATEWFTTDYATGTKALDTDLHNLTVTGQMPNDFIAVRPQTVGDDMTLGFKMTITTKYGTALASATTLNTEVIDVTSYAGTAPYTAAGIQLNAMTGAPATWAMNHKITYDIIIDPSTSTILYDPAVENWATEQQASVNVPK